MSLIRNWDTDEFDQFKQIIATNLTTLKIYPGNPLSWCNVKDVAFGQKQIQPQIRRPDQRVHISREVEYIDKFADRIVQVADLPAITDSIRVDEEYYAGDPTNALGHVGDLGKNYLDALIQYYITGTTTDPTTYGLIDVGAGTGSTTVTRPDYCAAVTTAGKWDVPASVFKDLSAMENTLTSAGFHGPKIMCTHPLVKPYLNLVLTSTATPSSNWIYNIGGYGADFCEYYDADATANAVDVYMVDSSAFDIYQIPIIARAHFNEDTENYYWRWKTRGYLLANPMHNGTDWLKGIVKCTVDIIT